jgi:multicomponent Na+:H+ antiporter subunit F
MRIELLLLVVINLALLLAFWRLVRGPSLADRVVALDLITTLIIGDITVFAIANNQPLLLDLVLVLALIAFLATVAFAHYIEKGGAPWRKS